MPRMNMSTGNLEIKPVPVRKVRPLEPKISNVDSKPLQAKKVVQKTKINNKEANQVLLMAKKDLKCLPKNSPSGVNQLALQKKNLVTDMQTQASLDSTKMEENHSALTAKKQLKLSNVQVQKTMQLEKTPIAQKIVSQEKLNTAQKSIPQVKTTIAQKTIHQEKPASAQKTIHQEKPSIAQQAIPEENATTVENTNDSTLNNKIQDSVTCISTSNTKNTKISAPDINSQGHTENAMSSPELAQNVNATNQVNKPEDAQKAAKGPTGDSETQKRDQSKTEMSSGEKLELDALLARAVEEELQDIMIQVWQELPDDPIDEEDRIAVDKLRNEVGDDLSRVLGLNITKRLLNVYNKLFIKMQFTCRPQMGCLTSFLNEYNIAKFKRIDKNSNTFAAQMETIEDFDKLCAVKELMCGEAKVSVIPCYKFTQCPENLKTIYDDTYFYEDSSHEIVEPQKIKNYAQKTKNITSNKNMIRPAAETAESKSSCRLVKTGNVAGNLTDKTLIQKAGNILQNVSRDINRDLENIDSTSTKKPNQTEIQKSVNLVDNDSSDIKKESTNLDKEKIIDSVKIKDKEVPNNLKNKRTISQNIAKYDISEYITKHNLEIDEDYLESCIPEHQMEDEDELDDEDILALMSEGVVLDECSGSEDDK